MRVKVSKQYPSGFNTARVMKAKSRTKNEATGTADIVICAASALAGCAPLGKIWQIHVSSLGQRCGNSLAAARRWAGLCGPGCSPP